MKIALLLDLDNIKPKLEQLEEICKQYGVVAYRRAFSNTAAIHTTYGSGFRRYNYRFELAPGPDPQPQEVDNLICATALDLANDRSKELDLFAIVSNDNDYAGLCEELQAMGRKTLIIGGKQIGHQLQKHATYIHTLDQTLRPYHVGIDLGTTNTVMAAANINLKTSQWTAADVPVSVTDELGSLTQTPLIPSCVRIADKGFEIGNHVRAQSIAHLRKTILSWKHEMGILDKKGAAVAYELESGRVLPEEAAAYVLRFCRDELLRLRQGLGGVVITHPASYEADAIAATRKAATLAGWEESEVVLLPEPHAALYDFLHRVENGGIVTELDVQSPLNLLVYDLGGGTLDVTLHRVAWNPGLKRFDIRDLAIGSRTRVGGDVTDALLTEYVLSKSPSYATLDERQKEVIKHEILLAAEKFKRVWGHGYTISKDSANYTQFFQGQFLDGRLNIRIPISRAVMTKILAPLLCEELSLDDVARMQIPDAYNHPPFTDRFNSFVVPVLELLLKARERLGAIPKIDGVLLNGGMTHFPLVTERLKELFQAIPLLIQGSPELAVARGAALYAAGAQGRAAQRVNPNNIYLEVTSGEQHQLQLLVSQGQTYPYISKLPGFKLPASDNGLLYFNIWVGMGNRRNLNTKLQRARFVELSKLHEANLHSGQAVDLKIEYTFDERLILTLLTDHASFTTEVSDRGKPPNGEDKAGPSNGGHFPKIPRVRTGKAFDERPAISLEAVVRIISLLARNYNDGILWQEFRTVDKTIASVSNRKELGAALVTNLPADINDAPALEYHRVVLRLRLLVSLLQDLPYGNDDIASIENQLQRWFSKQLLLTRQLRTEFLQEFGNLPGKMLWEGWDGLLVETFNRHTNQAHSQSLLTSVGRCVRPEPDAIKWLQNILMRSKKVGQRCNAAWALARLLSPGQESKFQADMSLVLDTLKIAYQRLRNEERSPQVLPELLMCIFQCLLWQRMKVDLADSLHQMQQKFIAFNQTMIFCYSDVLKYPHIHELVTKKLEIIKRIPDLNAMTEADKKEVEAYYLEIMK